MALVPMFLSNPREFVFMEPQPGAEAYGPPPPRGGAASCRLQGSQLGGSKPGHQAWRVG